VEHIPTQKFYEARQWALKICISLFVTNKDWGRLAAFSFGKSGRLLLSLEYLDVHWLCWCTHSHVSLLPAIEHSLGTYAHVLTYHDVCASFEPAFWLEKLVFVGMWLLRFAHYCMHIPHLAFCHFRPKLLPRGFPLRYSILTLETGWELSPDSDFCSLMYTRKMHVKMYDI